MTAIAAADALTDAPDLTEDPRSLHVLIVDDHDVVHWGFRVMLGQQRWVQRCLSARTEAEALALTRRYDPHVALVDLFVGPESGPEICERLEALSPRTQVLLISGASHISPNAARAAGAAGFVSKDWPAADIARAVRGLPGRGRRRLPPALRLAAARPGRPRRAGGGRVGRRARLRAYLQREAFVGVRHLARRTRRGGGIQPASSLRPSGARSRPSWPPCAG